MIYLIPAIIWSLLTTVACVIITIVFPHRSFFSLDKIGHILFFGGFIALWVWGILYRNSGVNPQKVAWIVFIAGILFSSWLEIFQFFFISDYYHHIIYGDFAADMLGCLIGLGMMRRWI